MPQCPSWSLISLVTRLFAQNFVQAYTKENTKAPRHWLLWEKFIGDRWIILTNVQWHGKCFHLMTSSCRVNVGHRLAKALPFADGMFKLIFLYENWCILIHVLLKFVLMGLIKISSRHINQLWFSLMGYKCITRPSRYVKVFDYLWQTTSRVYVS